MPWPRPANKQPQANQTDDRPLASFSTHVGRAATPRRARRCHNLIAAVGLLVAGLPTATEAKPVYLDFLYPTATSVSNPTGGPSIRRRDPDPTSTKLPVPLKYEESGAAWVLAETWQLHGRHRSKYIDTSPSSSFPTQTPSELENIHNLDSTMNTTLDLPDGWHRYNQGRHTNYDPMIVSIFATVLVLGIMITIGLFQWRARKTRRLLDVERSLQKAKADQDSDEPSLKSPKKGIRSKRVRKVKNTIIVWGKSTALARGLGGRITRRSRAISSQQQPEPAVLSPRASLTIPVHHSPVHTPSTISPSPSPPQTPRRQSTSSLAPTFSPPAYLIAPQPSSSRYEKSPIRGREDEYDDEELEAWRRRRRRRRSIDDEPEVDNPPSVSERESSRRAHVATDEKSTLERLRRLADQPSIDPSVVSEGSAPTWKQVDEWHTEQQLDMTIPSEPPHPPSTPPTLLTQLPTPTPALALDLDLGLGSNWSEMAPPIEEGTQQDGLVPSAPPLESEDLDVNALPPGIPSAPPLWDSSSESDGEQHPQRSRVGLPRYEP